MKTSYNWLKEYVDIRWTADELAHELTMAGLEVEDISPYGSVPESIVVVRIESRMRHPDAEKLSICEVSAGDNKRLRLVCGAPNCDAGKKAALAKIGTVLPNRPAISRTKIRGEYSDGMLCSERELGLGNDHSGIMILPDDAPVGSPLAGYLHRDVVIDWEVTPNRPDLLSHIGISREIAALSRAKLRLPEVKLENKRGEAIDNLFAVEVVDNDLCPRYTARLIRSVEIRPSPEWMKRYLKAIGLRPINNVVDITNFVLHECGQPLHAFDLKKLAGSKIIVRRASESETFTALDNKIHILNSNNLVIADTQRNVALGGVIGGANSEISEDTTDILLESAYFDPANIRATSKQLAVTTDSSYRFERGVDIEMVKFASNRAAYLICKYAGGRLVDGFIDVRSLPPQSPVVCCRYERVNNLIGVEISPEEIGSIFTRLSIDNTRINKDRFQCTIPSFRQDLRREVDLIEEVARIYGLNNIPASGVAVRSVSDIGDDAYRAVETIRNQLVSLGLTECVNYTMTSIEESSRSGVDPTNGLMHLKNPLSSELSLLRPNLTAGLIHAIRYNLDRGNIDLRMFEIGRVFGAGNDNDAHEEHDEACIALTGRRHPERYSDDRKLVFEFFDLQGIINDWFDLRRLSGLSSRPCVHPGFRKGACAEIRDDRYRIAVYGEIDPHCYPDLRLQHPLFLATINLFHLLDVSANPRVYQPLPPFPAVSRDVVFAANEALENQAVLDAIHEVGIAFLEKVELIEIYRDETVIGKGRKSMAYKLTYRSPECTLTDDQVNEAQERIRLNLLDKLPIRLR